MRQVEFFHVCQEKIHFFVLYDYSILFVNNSYKYIYIDLIMIVCKNNYGFCLNIRKLIILLYILCDEIRDF